MDDLKISNQLAEVEAWKPYDFLSFIEKELQLRGKDYQVMDLQSDLGSIKTCITYAKAVGKGNYQVVEYILWLLDGIKDPTMTSLQFLPASLRSYFGNAPASALPKTKKAKVETVIRLSSAMVTWLDALKQEKLL
jgi:hypothetical protein